MMLTTTVFVLLNTLVLIPSVHNELAFKYHSNEELLEYMNSYTARFPNIAELYSIGTSVEGVDLAVLKLTTTNNSLAPNVKLVGNIHGNEAIGREVLLQFLEYIGSTNDRKIKSLLNSTVLHILPSLNPDGFKVSGNQKGICDSSTGRNNANDIDLNRNFPDYFANKTPIEQPETAAIRQWLSNFTFTLSAAIHSGALVANYPFDSPNTSDINRDSDASLTPDDDVFQHLALTYSKAHSKMHKGGNCNGETLDFPNGITNGAQWYKLTGGMGDYNYAFAGVMELTLEIDCCKFPETRKIAHIYGENRDALIALWSEALRGVHGVIRDFDVLSNSTNISLKIKGREIRFYPDRRGKFWRVLRPGKYDLEIMLNNTIHMTTPFTVNNANTAILELNLFNTTKSEQSKEVVIGSTTEVARLSSTSTSGMKTMTTMKTTSAIATSNAHRNSFMNSVLGIASAFFLILPMT